MCSFERGVIFDGGSVPLNNEMGVKWNVVFKEGVVFNGGSLPLNNEMEVDWNAVFKEGGWTPLFEDHPKNQTASERGSSQTGVHSPKNIKRKVLEKVVLKKRWPLIRVVFH